MASLVACSCCARGIGKTGLGKFRATPAVGRLHQTLFRGAGRNLHRSAAHLQDDPHPPPARTVQYPESSLKIASASGNTPPPEDPEDPIDPEAMQSDVSAVPTSTPAGPSRPAPDSFARMPRSRGRPRGSSSRRGTRKSQSRERPAFKPRIPDWFIERNVALASALSAAPSDAAYIANSSARSDIEASSTIRSRKIRLSPYVRKELEAHSSAALLVPSTLAQDNFISQKAHIHLRCPRRGAIYFLDGIIEDLATQLDADIVRLDGQDVDELLELLIDPAPLDAAIGSQLFFTNIVRESSKEGENEEMDVEEEDEGMLEEEDEETIEASNEFRLPTALPLRLFLAPRPMYPSSISSSSFSFPNPLRQPPSKDTIENKVSKFLDIILSAPSEKRKALQKKFQRSGDQAPVAPPPQHHGRTVVYLRDLQSVLQTPRGQIAHQSLLQSIQNRRRLGERIMIIVSDDRGDDAIRVSPFARQYYHMVNVPPPGSSTEKVTLQDDRAARTREINLRSIQSAIRQRCRSPYMEFNCPPGIHLDGSATSCIPRLGREIWEIDKVQRIASIAIGNHGKLQVRQNAVQMIPMTIADIAEAVEDMEKADQERTEMTSEHQTARSPISSRQSDEGKRTMPLYNPVNSKDCTKHEQKLLSGVIDPDKIQVGFSDIRAPQSTIQTLKVLVSLPLRRPDAFSYGVLAKNFITGVLLFGPPGTGKTMLAKAVAKESGARVLEIKGSEVYDMYVGEGEKNVKAIFSLARKLSPCVVFIDEVDTIFSSRNGSERHVSHREIINQFMAEWDGINGLNSGILILGATNRPFDLDDAILRRMPRRILVDLPTEEDRLAILRLLLRDEMLNPSVDLPALAKRTNLYSGSDLKNVCVSAALAAVTEEQSPADILTPGHPNAPGKTGSFETSRIEAVVEAEPAKRVLNAHHFDRALTEVTASISESMETIELLRKFDREYGNAKEKKRKLMGFGTTAEETTANVRTMHP